MQPWLRLALDCRDAQTDHRLGVLGKEEYREVLARMVDACHEEMIRLGPCEVEENPTGPIHTGKGW